MKLPSDLVILEDMVVESTVFGAKLLRTGMSRIFRHLDAMAILAMKNHQDRAEDADGADYHGHPDWPPEKRLAEEGGVRQFHRRANASCAISAPPSAPGRMERASAR